MSASACLCTGFLDLPQSDNPFGRLSPKNHTREGMEACQAQENRLLRWSNLFSNAGRIPFIKVIAGGFGVLEVVRCFGRVFGRSRWWRLTMLVAAADGWASDKQDAAGMPLRLPPAQPSPGSHQSRLLPKTHTPLALRRFAWPDRRQSTRR